MTTNPNEVTQPMQGLAAYLRWESGSSHITLETSKFLRQWAKEVETAQSRSATSDAADEQLFSQARTVCAYFDRDADFDEIKQVIEALMQRLQSRSVTSDAALQAAIAQPEQPLSVAQYGRCAGTLKALGKLYSRTCAECGLGPCKTKSALGAQPEQPAAQPQGTL